MLEALSERLQGVFRKLGSSGTVTEQDLDDAMREVRVALLEADVNFKVVREFIANVREQAKGAEVLQSLTGPQQVIGIVNKELVRILGESQANLKTASSPPTTIMLVGLKGSGKTTTAAKLAMHLRKKGQKPLLVAADPYRVAGGRAAPSARTPAQHPGGQLRAMSSSQTSSRRTAFDEAKRTGASAIVVDTAGHTLFDDDVRES